MLSLGFVGWKLAARAGDGYGRLDLLGRAGALREDVADPVSQRQELREIGEKFVVGSTPTGRRISLAVS